MLFVNVLKNISWSTNLPIYSVNATATISSNENNMYSLTLKDKMSTYWLAYNDQGPPTSVNVNINTFDESCFAIVVIGDSYFQMIFVIETVGWSPYYKWNFNNNKPIFIRKTKGCWPPFRWVFVIDNVDNKMSMCTIPPLQHFAIFISLEFIICNIISCWHHSCQIAFSK